MQGLLDGRVAALLRRGVALPPPMVVADSWFSDPKLMRHMTTMHQGTFLVEGRSTYVLELLDGRQLAVLLLITPSSQPCPWRRVEMRGFSHFERAVGVGTSALIPLTCESRARAEGLGSRRPSGAPSRRGRAGGARPGGLAYTLLSPVLSAAQGLLAFGGGSPLGGAVLVPQTVIERRGVEDEY